jgi:hypothetical protein
MSTVKADYLVNAAGTGAPTLTNGAVLPAGSAAAPAISPTGDTNTGMFFPAADTIAFAEGGAEAMRIDSSGNVGIGTSSPATKLDVNGTITATGYGGTVDGTNKVGYRNIPPVGTKTSSYTLAVGDVGKYVQLGTSGAIVIPDATFAEGDAITLFNNTAGNITITCTITTAYISGTDADKATVTLATRGIANIFFISGTVCVITGNVT